VGYYGYYTDGSDFTCYDSVELIPLSCKGKQPDLTIKYQIAVDPDGTPIDEEKAKEE